MEQRTPEWHQARAGRITASIVGGLLDCAPYMSRDDAFRVLVRSLHGFPSEFAKNVAVDWAKGNEDLARQAYEIETGNDVKPLGFAPYSEWAGASPDGLIGDDGLLEIKCPFGIRKDNPPVFKTLADQPHYYGQVQFQMFCTGRNWCDFWQWTPHGSKLETVKYDGDWISENIPKLQSIWWRAKDAVPADYEGPKRKVIDTPESERLINEFDELSEAIENAADRKKDIIARLVEMSGGNDASVSGRNLTLVKRKGSVSYAKALKAIAPDADLEPYRGKASESWQVK